MYIKIATRSSPLAQANALFIKETLLQHYPSLDPQKITIVSLTTKGDLLKNHPLSDFGGKGLFCREIDEALLREEVDIAVHSLKDMPTLLQKGIALAAVPFRDDPRDAFFSFKASHLMDLPSGAVVGTASLRRQVQIKAVRPDLKVQIFRGNIGSRIEKLERGEVDATLLAVTGLKRLNVLEKAQSILTLKEMLPAVGQAALGLCIREGDTVMEKLLQPLHHFPTGICITAERTMLLALDGSCRTPIAAHARFVTPDLIELDGLLAAPDGSHLVRLCERGEDPIALGISLAKSLKHQTICESHSGR